MVEIGFFEGLKVKILNISIKYKFKIRINLLFYGPKSQNFEKCYEIYFKNKGFFYKVPPSM